MAWLIAFWRQLRYLRRRGFRYGRVALLLLILVVAGATLITIFEQDTNTQFQGFGDGLWWSLVTITTVGYGDKFPVTAGGRAVALITMVGGIGAFGYLAGTLLEQAMERERGRMAVDWEGHYLICDFSFKAINVVEELLSLDQGAKIVLIANLEENPLADYPHVHFIKGESTDEANLRKANVTWAKGVIVLAEAHLPEMEADAHSALTTLAVRHLNPHCWISAEVLHPRNRQHLQRAGADTIICTGEISSRLLVQASVSRHSIELLQEVLTNRRGNEIYEIQVPSFLTGRTFGEALQEVYRRRGILLGLFRENTVLTNPDAGLVLIPGDVLIYLAQEAVL